MAGGTENMQNHMTVRIAYQLGEVSFLIGHSPSTAPL